MTEMLSADPSDAEIIAAIERWVDDLASYDYESAFGRTEHDSYYGWTPALIEAVIQGYGLPEPAHDGPFVVTARLSASGQPRVIIERDEAADDVLAHVSYDLPLNGEWSDLTATFVVERRPSGAVIVLHEIHVL